MKYAVLLVVALALGACGTNLNELGREPTMAPVGYGLNVAREALPTARPHVARHGFHSIAGRDNVDLFRDPRASRVGDVITVTIAINDKAQFDNTTDRTRDSRINFGLDLKGAYNGRSGELSGDANLRSRTQTKGEGTIDRSEKLRLSVAAVVTEVLPGGNLLISGSQEVRVNYELRVLNIAGIVRPSDISRQNTIAYDKIAEARVSYGGRGRLMDFQQPAWGQQIYDVVAPF